MGPYNNWGIYRNDKARNMEFQSIKVQPNHPTPTAVPHTEHALSRRSDGFSDGDCFQAASSKWRKSRTIVDHSSGIRRLFDPDLREHSTDIVISVITM